MPREPFRVMFLQVSVILFSGGLPRGGGSASRGVCLQGRGSVSRGVVQNPPPPRNSKAGGKHPTGKLSRL